LPGGQIKFTAVVTFQSHIGPAPAGWLKNEASFPPYTTDISERFRKIEETVQLMRASLTGIFSSNRQLLVRVAQLSLSFCHIWSGLNNFHSIRNAFVGFFTWLAASLVPSAHKSLLRACDL
jgi:hypothetical protein